MLLDFCYYGNTISTPEILALLNPKASELHNILVQLLIFVVFAVPGYVCAILFLDKTGRKTIQTLGFGMMALMFLLLGLIPSATTVAATFIILYGISYFFTEFGPNTTTFIYPSEIFPVEVRTTASGIAAGAGKMGAFAGAYLFPDMLASSMGLRGAEMVAGIVAAAVGMLLTIFLLPEPKGKSLEELTEDAYAPAGSQQAGGHRMTYLVVVGVDGSAHSEAALRWALDHGRSAARRADGRVLLAGSLRVHPHGLRPRRAGAGIQAVPGRGGQRGRAHSPGAAAQRGRRR